MSCEVAPTYVMTIIETPAYRFSPLRLASLARSRSSQCSLANAPAGGWRSLPKGSELMIITFWATRNRYNLRIQGQPSQEISVLGLPASSLRCGGRQGSSLRSDELREPQNSSLRP